MTRTGAKKTEEAKPNEEDYQESKT